MLGSRVVPELARPVMGGLFLVGVAGGDLVLIQITVRLGGQLQGELVVRVLVYRGDLDVVQRDDARQGRDPADELPELVIAARETDLDGQLGVEILLLFGLRLEQLLLEAGREARLRDVDQQVGNFRLAGQLPQQRAERALDVIQLLLIEIEVDRLGMLGAELLAQLLLDILAPLQLGELRVPYEEIDEHRGENQEAQTDSAGPDGQRPAARIAWGERLQLFEQGHCRPPLLAMTLPLRPPFLPFAAPPPSSVAGVEGTSSAVSVKLEPGPVFLLVCTTSSSGFFSQSDASMLRIKEETRVLDWATPSNFNFVEFCITLVRYTPSGSVFTISSNTCTISGRERCSWSMMVMRAMNFCFEFSRLLISSICLSTALISLRNFSLRASWASPIEPKAI